MENVNWGIPTLRKRKEEKYVTPVVAMSSLSIKGAGRKFSFNRAAQKAMGMDSEKEQSILVGFDAEGGVYFKVVDGESTNGYRLTQTGSFSNKKVYEFIAKNLELDTEVENEFAISSLPNGTFRMEDLDGAEVAPEEVDEVEGPTEEPTMEVEEEIENVEEVEEIEEVSVIEDEEDDTAVNGEEW